MKNKLQVIKIGGNVVNDDIKLMAFLKSFASTNTSKILVHGGGKIATEMSKKLGITTRMVDGRRVTTDEDLEIVTMVYAGLISKQITAKLQAHGCNAMGLAGSDANTITAEKRPVHTIDYGHVGDITQVDSEVIQVLLSKGITPVFSAICHDGRGHLLNTNADTIAAEIASAMSDYYAVELIYCFEKKGVLGDINDDQSVIEHIDFAQYEQLMADGIIDHGMLPKLKNCFYALDHHVTKVKIGDPHLLENTQALHTTITKS